MRNKIIALIQVYAEKNGIHYTHKELQTYSNEDLISTLLEEHADYVMTITCNN